MSLDAKKSKEISIYINLAQPHQKTWEILTWNNNFHKLSKGSNFLKQYWCYVKLLRSLITWKRIVSLNIIVSLGCFCSTNFRIYFIFSMYICCGVCKVFIIIILLINLFSANFCFTFSFTILLLAKSLSINLTKWSNTLK